MIRRLFILSLALSLSGCTIVTGAGGDKWFVGYYGRLGFDLRANKIVLIRTPTTQSATIDHVDAKANPDVVKSITAGVVQGVLGIAGKP